MSAVVSNSSPLIALEQLDLLGLLEQIFGGILVPPAVAKEVAPTVTLTLNLIPELKPHLETLLQHHFRVSPLLYEQVLKAAGELP